MTNLPFLLPLAILAWASLIFWSQYKRDKEFEKRFGRKPPVSAAELAPKFVWAAQLLRMNILYPPKSETVITEVEGGFNPDRRQVALLYNTKQND